MASPINPVAKNFYNNSYEKSGFSAQRRYPNEELLRFLGRNFFSEPFSRRKNIKILEVGCGSGANLWAIAREGFDTHGLDFSAEGIELCRQMLASWGVTATLQVGDMTEMPYHDQYFDVIIDVFSAYCFNENVFSSFLDEITRVLRPGGQFFSYSPSKSSDVFRDTEPSMRLDASTLDGIHRPTAPFYGNLYPFHFITLDEYKATLLARGLNPTYGETVGRTYRSTKEYFEFVVIVAEKPSTPP